MVGRKKLRPVQPKAVEPSAQRQRFKDPLVAVLQIDAAGKVKERMVRGRLAAGDDRHHRALAHPAHGAKAKPDGTVLVHGELEHRLVHVRPKDRHALPTGLLHEVGHFLDVVHVVGQLRRHELRGVVGLEVGGLVRHPGIARRVGLVEGIGGEGLPVRPNLLQLHLVVPIGGSPLQEVWTHLVDEVLLLLSHRLSKAVRFALGEVGELLGKKHDLLLVDRDAVRLLQVFLAGVQIV